MIMGLTGGIASGKSTVSAWFVNKGARLVDADIIAREVMLPGHPVLDAAVKRFGEGILQPDGSLNRAKLGEIVFADKEALQALNAITHPAIRKEIKARMHALEEEDPRRLTLVDIPLLYESELDNLFERIAVVYVPREVQRERLMARNGMTEVQAESRLKAQMDIEEKRRRATFVIDNSGSPEDTKDQVDELWDRLGL
ncbi:dephospho-CoA kinase [Paenibacillus sp. NFR01]|uniref:dephospho-CoA kinase n=1 Tax=Paenibacillus sp. NFR01 TaxID=1566279 RepID=UPI0008D02F3E|nr:dephospho-CoA kinase [Paenibacillus sp. NFR01]SES94440.1 dephospho-CoA kinase [Paenibacillus sp. NFR01]